MLMGTLLRIPKKIFVINKIWTMWLYHRVKSPNDADRMVNSVDPDQTVPLGAVYPDQTVPLGAVWSGSALFAQAYLSENLGSLRYSVSVKVLEKLEFRISFADLLLWENCKRHYLAFRQ